MHGLPLSITSSRYWKSMSGTHENQCISPCTCGLLHTSKPIEASSRPKKVSISGGQQSEVTALNPAAVRGADVPSVPVSLGAGVAAGAGADVALGPGAPVGIDPMGAGVGAGVGGTANRSFTD